MLQWYRAGINPQDKLPFLATYLGHRDIHSTLVYITVTQDLLQQANERFRAFAAHRLHITEGCSHEADRPAPQSPAHLLLLMDGSSTERFSPHSSLVSRHVAPFPQIRCSAPLSDGRSAPTQGSHWL